MFTEIASLTLPRRGPPTELGGSAKGLLTPIHRPPKELKTNKKKTKQHEEIQLLTKLKRHNLGSLKEATAV